MMYQSHPWIYLRPFEQFTLSFSYIPAGCARVRPSPFSSSILAAAAAAEANPDGTERRPRGGGCWGKLWVRG